jgi:hypothetical protein
MNEDGGSALVKMSTELSAVGQSMRRTRFFYIDTRLDAVDQLHTRGEAATATLAPKRSLQELQARQKESQRSIPTPTEKQLLGGRRTSPRNVSKVLPKDSRAERTHALGTKNANTTTSPVAATKAPFRTQSDHDRLPDSQAASLERSLPSKCEVQVSKEISAAILTSEKNRQSKKRAEVYAVAYTTHPYWKLQVPLVTTEWDGQQGAYAMSHRQQCAFRSFKGPHAQYLATAYAFSGGWVSSTVGIKSSEDLLLHHQNFATYGGWAAFEHLIATLQLVPYPLKTKARMNNAPTQSLEATAASPPPPMLQKKRAATLLADFPAAKKKATPVIDPASNTPASLAFPAPPQLTAHMRSLHFLR